MSEREREDDVRENMMSERKREGDVREKERR